MSVILNKICQQENLLLKYTDYIYIYIYRVLIISDREYMRVIWLRWIFPKELAMRSNVYCCLVFKEINNDDPFLVQEDWQYDLLYWLQHEELFLFWSVSVFTFDGLFFKHRLIMAKPCLIHLQKFFHGVFFSWHINIHGLFNAKANFRLWRSSYVFFDY